jgi:rhodanese-related sulfurtransferase
VRRLRELGLTASYALEGGFAAWRDLGYPLESKGPRLSFF